MTRAGCLVVVALGAGCIADPTVPCGDLSCPAGDTCAQGRCVAAAQIAACEEEPDGAGCTVGSEAGACTAGVCELAVCGDGDLDAGESCDCGRDDATRPSFCLSINADDLAAECDPQCSRRCGDGVVTGGEQCDGEATTLTCASFGFYAGELACTPTCLVDRSGCAEQCGDGIVQADRGERCDGAPPEGESCFDYGYDTGLLACSASCAPDLSGSCVRYGWELLMTAEPEQFFLGATANARGPIAFDPTGAVGRWNGVAFGRAGTYTHALASTTRLGVAGPTELAFFDGTAWEVTPLAIPPVDARTTPAGATYVLDEGCGIQAIGAAAIAPVPDTGCMRLLIVSATEAHAVATTNGTSRLWSWDGATWSRRDDVPVGRITDLGKGGEALVVDTTGGTYRLTSEGPVGPLFPFRAGQGMAVTGDTVVGAGEDITMITVGSSTQVLRSTSIDQDAGALRRPVVAADGRIVGVAGAVYRLRPLWQRTLPGLDEGLVKVNASDELYACNGAGVFALGPYDATDLAVDGACSDLAFQAPFIFAATSSGLWRRQSTLWLREHAGVAQSVFIAEAGEGWAIVDQGVWRRDSGGTWSSETVAAGCTWTHLAGVTSDHVYVQGRCDGFTTTLAEYRDGAWTLTPTEPQSALWAARTGELFGSSGRWTGTEWMSLGVAARTVHGTSAADVWFVSAQEDTTTGGVVLWHWDGTRALPQRLPPLDTTRVQNIAVTPYQLVVARGAVAQPFLRLP